MNASPSEEPSLATTTLPPETYLATLLALARSTAKASAAALQLQEDDAWRCLAEAAATTNDLSRLHTLMQEPPHRARDRPDGLPCLVQIPTRPSLRLALLVPDAPPRATVEALEQMLYLAVPILRAAAQERRLREAFRALLELEAELAQELRTPLTAVSGFTQLLRRGGEIEERRRTSYAAIASEETEQVASAIDQIIAKVQRHAAAIAAASGGFVSYGESTTEEPDTPG